MNEILLRTNKGEYFPGEDVFGVVYLKIEDPTSGCGISLIFKGYEHFSYEYISKVGKNCLEATKDYIDFYNVVIYNGTEPFAIGSYIFPFKVTLPKVLPGSLQASGYDSVTWDCIVEYWLQASVIDSDLNDTQGIVVIPKAAQDCKESVQSVNQEHVVRKFPWFKSINFTFRLVNPCPVTGENLRLRLITTNSSSVKIHSFRIKLIRNILFVCKKDVPIEKLMPNISCLQHRTYIQVDEGSTVVNETGGSTHGLNPTLLSQVMDNILLPLKSRDGSDLPPSIRGHHIECNYCVTIEITLSNQAVVEMMLSVPCIQPRKNQKWQAWRAPEWTATGQVLTSTSRFSVSEEQLHGEAFSALPGFQAL